jgi:ABC-2 type transport system permease protein
MLKTAWILARKDLAIYFRDRTALLLSLALPVFLVTIFGAAMGGMMSGGGGDVARVKLFVEDLDQSTRSKALIEEIGKTAGLEVKLVNDVRVRVAQGKGPAALLIPSGYGDDLAKGIATKLVLYRDPGQTIEQQIVAGNLMPALFKATGRDIGRAMMKKSMAAFGFSTENIPDSALGGDAPANGSGGGFDFLEDAPKLLGVQVEDVAGGEDPSQKTAGQSHAVAGVAVMMLLFGLSACGGTILEEEAQGTLQRLRLTPASGRTILAGKFLFTVVVGMMQLSMLFAYGGIVFQVPIFRAPIALLTLTLAVASAATGLGILLAVLCRSRKQLEGLSTLIILVMSALGGSWFPLIVTPAWYQKLGHFTLNAWAMDGYQGIFWYGKDLSGIALEIGVLFAIAAVTSFIAVRAWKRRFEVAS